MYLLHIMHNVQKSGEICKIPRQRLHISDPNNFSSITVILLSTVIRSKCQIKRKKRIIVETDTAYSESTVWNYRELHEMRVSSLF